MLASRNLDLEKGSLYFQLPQEKFGSEKFKNYSFDRKILNPDTEKNSAVNLPQEERNELINTFNVECEDAVSEVSEDKESVELQPTGFHEAKRDSTEEKEKKQKISSESRKRSP